MQNKAWNVEKRRQMSFVSPFLHFVISVSQSLILGCLWLSRALIATVRVDLDQIDQGPMAAGMKMQGRILQVGQQR
jgi:hypothetical protein